jgi:hypothetical protein
MKYPDYYYGSTVLCWTLAAISVYLSYTHLVGLLDGGSARCKASTYKQSNTNTEKTHTIQTFHALHTRGHCDRYPEY